MAETSANQTEATYARAGFGGSVRRGERPAIVVVDLIKGFTDVNSPFGSDLTDVVAATGTLIEAGRPAGVPVLFTTISYTDAELAGDTVRWLDKAQGMRGLREGSEAVRLDPRLPAGPADPVIVKKGASAFHGTSLAATLSGLGCDTILVCGATTSGCIRATAVDGVQSGFSVLVPRECVGDRAQAPHDANLFDIQAKYGDVIGVADARAYLDALPARPGPVS